MEKNGTEIIKPGRRIGVPFVTVVFFLMLVYLLIRSRDLFRGNSISAYNVGAPAVDSLDRTFTGLILREEKIVIAESGGTVHYYRSGGERLSRDSLVCVIDRENTLLSTLRSVGDLSGNLSKGSVLKIRDQLEKVQDSFDPRHFGTAEAAEASLQGLIYTRLLEECGDRFADPDAYVNVRSSDTGFLLLTLDGLEGMVPEKLRISDFTEEAGREERMSGEEVRRGDFLYKLALDNRFTLVFPLTDEEAAGLSGRKSLSVTMDDGLTITGAFSLTALSDGTRAGVLNFQKYGLNYLDGRLREFRLADEEVKGFKIPESAITRKSFFVVPSEFVTDNAQGNGKAVLLETSAGAVSVPVTAYGKGKDDSKDLIIGDGVTYILSEELKAGDVLLFEERDPETGQIRSKRETLGVMASLEGVYQINKGYCVFRPVLRLKNSVDSSFIMVSADIGYGLRSYDRIVMDSSGVKENDIIFE